MQIDAGVDSVQVLGNFIGTDASAILARAIRKRDFVEGTNVRIGGTNGWEPGGACTGDCNLVSGHGNGEAITLGASASGAVVYGNMIGTNAAGTEPIVNTFGIRAAATNVMVGGSGPGEGNLVSTVMLASVSLAMGGNSRGQYIGVDIREHPCCSNQTTRHGIRVEEVRVPLSEDFSGCPKCHFHYRQSNSRFSNTRSLELCGHCGERDDTSRSRLS